MEVVILIREFSNNDLDSLLELLKQGYIISTEEATSELTGANQKIYIYDDGIIKGFALITSVNVPTKMSWIKIYVGKSFRHGGIGTMLHEKAIKCAKNEFGARIIATKFSSLKDAHILFFKNLNYEKWFVYHSMKYHGGLQPEHGLNFINYEDKYFEKYITLEGESFYNLRKANDIKPYNCSDFSDSSRQHCLNSKAHIYLLLDHEDEIISSIYINDGFLDKIMVSKKHECQGYGCKTTQFGINKSLKEGSKSVELCALLGNNRAIYIYEALGFDVVQTYHNYRQFIK